MTAELAARIIIIEEEDPLRSSASSTSAPTAVTPSYHFILDNLILSSISKRSSEGRHDVHEPHQQSFQPTVVVSPSIR